MNKNIVAAAASLLLGAGGIALAQDASVEDSIAAYREMLADDNPAELWEIKGREFWSKKRGPKNASLEACNLGLGSGMVKGAFAQLPRYFADAGRVQDLEMRLVSCMIDLQGLSRAEAEKNHFSTDNDASDIEALVAWIASESKGAVIAVPQTHPKEKEAYAIGEKLFHFRTGPYDFACSTCHSTSGTRIRLQVLPNLTEPAEAKPIFATWPAYRVSQGTVRSMENRITDCLRQQRMPLADYGADVITDLTVYMGVQAAGGQMAAPGLKR
ncbi:MAG: sulfur oxidation c-type cytochrome SoxA [Xanthomonadaceae bacterium]|nr:sulfur oxidation c-type cytochrome SoxA [Xanthomonadaceae bacterium]